ncbi:carbohydrate binding domain-containing protein [Marinimicrobium agarilyticum]|uniref:carbohydrate binding domain-containing protein n=1 Tax=Marinimicrobium agarilyticum TaxID=306546 RepID=UPI000409BCDC|nr:carbohydrate binding domain-containing protein [Marinimicrobium agarilyticum]
MKKQMFKKVAGALAAGSLLLGAALAQAAPLVDVLVLYIDEAQQTSAGRDIEARIGAYISYNNQAFENSNVDMRLRLVGAEKVDLDYTYVTSENLGALRSNSTVAALRQEYGADLVTLLNLRQPMSGGYICGIGYIPWGDASNGRLASNAGSAAFSLVGVDCGLSTFAHELGHNMSLGHSYVQNSGGGVWEWARGHGVQGLFSTVMAYPQSYGTRNQIQIFSTPDVVDCSGQPCGVDRSQPQGADASRSLNNLAQQIADFMPHVTDIDGPDPDLEPCSKPEVEGNLVTNGEFDTLLGWQALFNVSRLTQADQQTDCVDKLLRITDRTQVYSDGYHDLGRKLEVNNEYRFTASLGVAGAERDTVRIALRIEEGGGIRYQYLDPVSVTSAELTAYSASFLLDATTVPDSVGLILYGPQPGVDIIADEVALVDVSNSEPEPDNQTVLNESFEREASGWSSFGASQTAFSSRASEGDYSLRNYSRQYSYSGPMREVTGLFDAETTYTMTADIYVEDASASSANASVWIYYVDDQGSHWQSVLSTMVSTNSWQGIEGEFTIMPEGDIRQMRFLIGGPSAGSELYLDELRVVRP